MARKPPIRDEERAESVRTFVDGQEVPSTDPPLAPPRRTRADFFPPEPVPSPLPPPMPVPRRHMPSNEEIVDRALKRTHDRVKWIAGIITTMAALPLAGWKASNYYNTWQASAEAEKKKAEEALQSVNDVIPKVDKVIKRVDDMEPKLNKAIDGVAEAKKSVEGALTPGRRVIKIYVHDVPDATGDR